MRWGYNIMEWRGKDINTDKWVYGDLITAENKRYIAPYGYKMPIKKDGNIYVAALRLHEIKWWTLGEYIGLCDKNYKPIYDDDIVKIEDEEGYWKIVFWIDCWYVMQENKKKRISKYINTKMNKIIVVGNTFDNPELKTL